MLSASSLIGLRATLGMAGLLSSTPPPSLGLGDTHFSDYRGFLVHILVQVLLPLPSP